MSRRLRSRFWSAMEPNRIVCARRPGSRVPCHILHSRIASLSAQQGLKSPSLIARENCPRD